MTEPEKLELSALPLDSVVAHGGAGRIGFHRVLDGQARPGAWNFVDYAVLPPGASIGVHTHGDDEELYLVLEGRGRMHLDGREFPVGPGSVVVNRPFGTHGLANTGDGTLRLFVVEVPRRSEDHRPAAARATALVLAGGRGSRMAAADPELPKPLAKVGGIALLEWALRSCAAAGIPDVRVALCHRAAELASFVRSLAPPLCAARSVIEVEPLGTIGALGLLGDVSGTVVALNADNLSAIPLDRLLAEHRRTSAHLTIATHEERLDLRLGQIVATPDGLVREYREKPSVPFRISSGLYAIEPAARALVLPGEALGFDQLARRALDAGLEVREWRHDFPWADVNDRAALASAEALLASARGRFPPAPGPNPGGAP